MNLNTVRQVLDAEVICCAESLGLQVRCGGAADLMSDVLAFALADSLLLTGLIHPQTIRTAEIASIRAIVFVRGKLPPAETVQLAREVEIPLLSTRFTMYEACGRLYEAGLPGLGMVDTLAENCGSRARTTRG